MQFEPRMCHDENGRSKNLGFEGSKVKISSSCFDGDMASKEESWTAPSPCGARFIENSSPCPHAHARTLVCYNELFCTNCNPVH